MDESINESGNEQKREVENHELELSFLRKRLLLSAFVPAIILFFMWIIRICESLFNIDLAFLGVYPLKAEGLPGIIFSPFIHSGFAHLAGNTLPLLLLGTALFYFYRDIAWTVGLITWIFSGIFLWLTGREAWHIGASGLIYGFASFLFFSGILRRHFRLVALSLLIVFLYGSMVWGMFPEIYKDVSWEAHALGFVAGIFLAIVLRNKGPELPRESWMDEEEEGQEQPVDEIMPGKESN